MAATRAMVEFVMHNPLAREFTDWARDIAIPDEVVFQTLNNNPHVGAPGAYTGKGVQQTWCKLKFGESLQRVLTLKGS